MAPWKYDRYGTHLQLGPNPPLSWLCENLIYRAAADRTTLVARELGRCKVDTAALSETRFSYQGQLEVGAGYFGEAVHRQSGATPASFYHPDRNRGTPALSAAGHQRSPDEFSSASSGDKFATIVIVYASPLHEQPRRGNQQILRGSARPPVNCAEGG
ncbi:unnamed protein product [Schistocephalus solidus]|uniref:Glyco_hydro_65N domain-containing protein n=1 Tax=Schistocephalus solidus TaxID=70667 RepID=A0A183T746_SCHSO|nr:unnamed protein product [Schistocephalus solidus]